MANNNTRKEPKLDPEASSFIPPKYREESELAKSINQFVDDANHQMKSIPMQVNNRDHDFVRLAESCAEGMIQSAEAIMNEAQSLLERTKIQAEELVTKAREHGRDVNTFTDRLHKFGGSILNAHENFHKPPPLEEPKTESEPLPGLKKSSA